jgi:pimeloyl-ACP methyl ester carboxylesterase
MRTLLSLGIALLAAALASCSDGTGGSTASTDTSGARGSLIFNPPLRVATLTAVDLTAQLNAQGTTGQQLLALATAGTLTPGVVTCGVDVHYLQYGTVDGGNGTIGAGNVQAPTTASGALMVPTGPAPACSGPRPILLYAHGTATDRTTNLANITNPNNTEGVLIAAMFAAQGFIVIAPNYAGYDSSPLQYHPFLNGDQQSKEMIDALKAGRKALGNIPASATTDAGILFVTGYSQGGYVAMATAKAMQALQGIDPTLTVTASAPMSGPYALEAFGDMVFFGGVNLGSTVFAPMIATSYQRQFGNIYASPTDTTNLFAAQYAATIDALLPSNTPLSTLISTGKIPQLGLLSSTAPTGTCNDGFFSTQTPFTGGTPSQNALFALGFTPNGGDLSANLIVNSARVGVVCDAFVNADGAFPTPSAGVPLATNPTHPLRQALKANDMRTWAPTHPMFLCGGGNDPTVFFPTNTGTMAGTGPSGSTTPNHAGTFWDAQATGGLVRVFDVDTAPLTAPNTLDPAGDQLRGAFAATLASISLAAGSGVAGQQAVVQAYHTTVAPFCSKAAQGFFAQVLATIPFPFP